MEKSAEQYWARAKEAEEHAERAQGDLAANRTWREVAAKYRELALDAERNRNRNAR